MRRRNAAALAASFCFASLVGSPTARANSVTYNIVDYPAAETDEVNSLQDKVSGTITISALGSYTAGSFNPSTDPNDVSLSFSITLSNADFSAN